MIAAKPPEADESLAQVSKTPPGVGALVPSARRRSAVLAIAVGVLILVLLTRGITRGEFNLITDETINAATGLYFADLLRDFPVTHPVAYTYRYYAQYPALGIFHWPPFFHLTEGIMFLLLGPSAVTARLTVIGFALLGACFWYKLICELQNEKAAAASTLLWVLLPSLLLYEKAVMLEIPALALSFAAIYYWIQYLRHETGRALYSFAVFSGLALLTKYQSIYLVAFCLLTVLVERKWSLLFKRKALQAFGIFLLLTVPYTVLAYKVHGRVLTKLAFAGSSADIHAGQRLNAATYYWVKLPDQIGWPVLLLSALGVATCGWWARRGNAKLMLAWIASCYATFTLITAKEPRFIIYWLPAFAFFAVGPLTADYARGWLRLLGAGVALALLGGFFWVGWNFERPYVAGYEALARRVTQSSAPGPNLVLFDGDLPGNFIFYVRRFDPERRFFVLRKALYVMRNVAAPGAQLVHTKAGVEELIDRYGIRDVVVTGNMPLYLDAQKALREVLQTPQFRLVGSFPVETNVAELEGRRLLYYENTAVRPRTARTLTLKMPALSHDIVVPVDEGAAGEKDTDRP